MPRHKRLSSVYFVAHSKRQDSAKKKSNNEMMMRFRSECHSCVQFKKIAKKYFCRKTRLFAGKLIVRINSFPQDRLYMRYQLEILLH